MEANLVKVKGMSGWYKNIETGTVINTNEDDILLARKRKEFALQERETKNNMKIEISSLKDEMAELKALIQTLVEGK
jgi:hypothetical protein|tara:strand:- start:5578 stop:5808 length:231 start_codon:yes stop_codon:yes gene_type:complete